MCPTGMRGAAHDRARRTLRRLPVVSVPHMPAAGRIPPGAPPGAQVRSPSRATPVGRHGAWLYATPTAPPFGPDTLSGPSHLRRPRAHQGPPWTCPASWPDLCARMRACALAGDSAARGATRRTSVTFRVTACIGHAVCDLRSYAEHPCAYLRRCRLPPHARRAPRVRCVATGHPFTCRAQVDGSSVTSRNPE